MGRHAVGGILAVVGAVACGAASDGRPVGAADLERGREVFGANCAACHGESARGTTAGPPLVHEVYVPSHHSDAAFHRAVRAGSPQHHWEFGAMAPVPGLSDQDIVDVTAYVRDLQRAAGIIE
jgi:cytochrome c